MSQPHSIIRAISPSSATLFAANSGGAIHPHLWFPLLLLVVYTTIYLWWDRIVVPFCQRRVARPWLAEYALFVINAVSTFGLIAALFEPHPYLCFLYILPIMYLSIRTDLKTTAIGSLFAVPLIFFTLLHFGLGGERLIQAFAMFSAFCLGIGFALAYLLDRKHQEIIHAKKQADASSEELASAYGQLKAYTQVLEATTLELEKKTLNLSAINTFNQILNSRLTWVELNSRILGFVANTFNAKQVALLLKSAEGGQLEVISRRNGNGECALARVQPDKRNWFYLSFFEAAHLVNLDERRMPEYRDDVFWSDEAPKSLVAVPLYRGRDVFGSLVLGDIARELNKEDLDLLQITANQIAIATERSRMYDELERNYLSTLRALANSIEAKDPYTRGHSERVTHMALIIGEAMDLSDRELSTLHYGGILHDIGKIGVSESILNKSGELTKEEFSVIQRHPVIGEEIVSSIPFLRRALPLIRHHHERLDGKGYPDGLSGDNILLPVRILSVCDAFDAMSSDRPYRKALPLEICIRELQDKTGSQFDPEVVQVFLRLLRRDPAVFEPPS